MLCFVYAQRKKEEDAETKKKKDGVNLVIPYAPSADNSNLSADGEDSFISVDMESAMPSPFSEVRQQHTDNRVISLHPHYHLQNFRCHRG